MAITTKQASLNKYISILINVISFFED